MSLETIECRSYGPTSSQIDGARRLVHGSVHTDEGLLAYWAARPPGATTDILLLPGLGCPWFLMAPLAVATGQKCLIPALPGTSGTGMPTSGYTLHGVLRMIEEACQSLGVSPTAVIGHSLGALVASALTRAAPWNVNDLILICPPGETLQEVLGSERAGVPFAAKLYAALGLLGMAASTKLPSWLAQGALTWRARYNPILRYCFAAPARLPERHLRHLMSTMTPGPIVETLKQARTTDTAAVIRSSEARRRIAVYGERDPLVPARDAAAFAGQNKDWQTLLMSPAAHWLPFEHPNFIASLLRTGTDGASCEPHG